MNGITTNLIGGVIGDQGQTITGEPLLIIGTALDGPLNTPIRVRNYSEFEKVFGPAIYTSGYNDPNTSTETGKDAHSSLAKNFVEALNELAKDIVLVRCSGSYASSPSAFSNKLDIRAVYPGRIYNSVSVQVYAGTGASSGFTYFKLTQPTNKEGIRTFEFANTQTIGELIDFINSSNRNRTISINRNSWPTALTSLVTALGSGTVTLSGGTNGTTAPGEDYATSKQGLADMIAVGEDSTFNTLIGDKVRASIIHLGCIYFDDEIVDAGSTSTSIYADMALFAEYLSHEASPCLAYLGCRPTRLRDRSAILDYVNNSLLATEYGYFSSAGKWLKAGPLLYNGIKQTSNGETLDLGRRVLVVAGPDAQYTHPQLGVYYDTPTCSIAALHSTLSTGETLTFKRLRGVLSYDNTYPGYLAQKLTFGVGHDGSINPLLGKGAYIVLAKNGQVTNESLVILSDPTAADRNNDFRQASTIRTCNSILGSLRDRLVRYCGIAASPAVLANMKTAVKDVLDSYSAEGSLQGGEGVGYKYSVYQTVEGDQIGQVMVDLSLLIARTINEIQINLTVARKS